MRGPVIIFCMLNCVRDIIIGRTTVNAAAIIIDPVSLQIYELFMFFVAETGDTSFMAFTSSVDCYADVFRIAQCFGR